MLGRTGGRGSTHHHFPHEQEQHPQGIMICTYGCSLGLFLSKPEWEHMTSSFPPPLDVVKGIPGS